MQYLDFEIEIQHEDGRDYRVAIIRSPAGCGVGAADSWRSGDQICKTIFKIVL